jgi:uncharacterized protein (TIGR02466 family)
MIDVLFGDVLYSNQLNINTQDVIKKMSEPRKAEIHKSKDKPKSDASLYVLEEKQHATLKKIIDAEIYEYANNIMKYNSKFNITTSWFTEVDTKERGDLHKHTNSFLSGVLYLNVNKKSGNITFEKFTDEISVTCTEYNKLNGKTYSIQPENGLILLFPSKLWHSVGYNESEQIRNSLAFNVMPVGKVGLSSSDSHMKIKLV